MGFGQDENRMMTRQRAGDERRERRCEQRQCPGCGIAVYDGISTRLLGEVGDLTRRGLCLLCQEPVTPMEEYRLRLVWSAADGVENQCMIQARCCWYCPEHDSGRCLAGFQFVQPSLADQQDLHHLLERC